MTGDTTELALRAAINLLRDSIETGRMPSGLELAPAAVAAHEAAVVECERLLASAESQSRTPLEERTMSEPHVPAENPDVWVIDLCQLMLAVYQEIDDLVDRDPYAPDHGPNNERHDALWDELGVLQDQLTEVAPPTTPEGIRALAQASVLFAPRTSKGTLIPEGYFDRLRLLVVTIVAGAPETIPLPRGWDEATC